MATEKEAPVATAEATTEEAKGTATHKKPGTGKKAAEGEEGDSHEDEVVYHEPVVRQKKKSNWDLKKCQKVARRFDSVDAWRDGAPSCYKSANANNWIAQCTSHMKSSRFVKKSA